MTNGITTNRSEVSSRGDCDFCPDSKDVDLVNGMCAPCIAKTTSTSEVSRDEVSHDQIVVKSDTPINERLKKAYIDKFNSLMVGRMSQDELMRHIADQEDMIKVLQAQLQASLDVDDEWSATLSKEEREAKREKDKQYRALARPRTNSDGTLKLSKPKSDKPKLEVAEGNKAFDSLVSKLMLTGMSKENAINLVKGMK
jgi:hypothetical protein